MSGLGRRVPTDWSHLSRYPASAVLQPAETVERTLRLPRWHQTWNQGREGACVGFGCSMMMSILNGRRYDPRWLWDRAKEVDEWPDTNPGDDNGTSVRAACDVLRTKGHVRVYGGRDQAVNPADGISANRWALSVDEMRSSIKAGIPVTIGIDWVSAFDDPTPKGREWWIGGPGWDRTRVRGGHCVCVYAASDRREAFKFKNSWLGWPLCWLPYGAMELLLARDGEACLVSDR